MKFTASDLYRCADREVSYRQRVYPRRVMQGKMASDEADREILMMNEIVEILHARMQEQRQVGLFKIHGAND